MDKEKKGMVINATPLLSNLTGVGQVVHEVSKRLHDFDIRIDYYTPLGTFSSLRKLQESSFRLKLIKTVKKLSRKLPFKKALRHKYAQTVRQGSEYALYWEPNYVPVNAINARNTVVTIYDMSVLEHPEWHPADRVSFFHDNFRERIKRADLVTTISEFSRERFLALQDEVPEERTRVIPCGVNRDVFYPRSDQKVETFSRNKKLPDQFILFVGTVEPRKNLLHLLKAYELLTPEQRKEFPLVLAGDKGWQNQEIIKHLKKLGSSVIRVGYMQSPKELSLMYNAATILAFPSLYEGFGIPPLEAMACGTPVCLSSIPVFREIYGDDAACYGSPSDVKDFSNSLRILLRHQSYRRELQQRGFKLARHYTWKKASAEYKKVFQELL